MKHKRLAAALLAAPIILTGCTADPSVWDEPTATPSVAETPEVVGPPTTEPTIPTDDAPVGPWQLGTVTRVIDGDTFVAEVAGVEETVRVLGIDTPETKHPSKGVECFGPEASAEAELVLAGNDVHLVLDSTEPVRDQYGRLLAHVEMAYGGGDFAEYMVGNGYARANVYSDTHDRADKLAAAEEYARANLFGLWGACQR